MAYVVAGMSTGNQIPKLLRTIKVMVNAVGSKRPASGQLYPRGK